MNREGGVTGDGRVMGRGARGRRGNRGRRGDRGWLGDRGGTCTSIRAYGCVHVPIQLLSGNEPFPWLLRTCVRLSILSR